MSWQPISGAGLNGVNEGVNILTQAMQGYNERKRQQELDRYNALMGQHDRARQMSQDARQMSNDAAERERLSAEEARKIRGSQTDAVLKARAISRTDPDGAMAILRGAGATGISVEDLFDGPAPPELPHGGSPVPDQVEFPKLAPPSTGGITQPVDSEAEARPQDAQSTPAAQAAPATPRKFIGKKISYSFGEGDQGSLDPRAAIELEKATRTEKADAMKGAFGGDQKWAGMASSLASAGFDADSVAKIVTSAMEKENQATQSAELRREGFHQSDENSKRMTQAIIEAAKLRTMPEIRNDASVRGDIGAINAQIKSARDAVDWRKLVQGDRALRAAGANLLSDGPQEQLKHKDAMIQLARYFRGNIPTEGEMKMLYDHLNGAFGKGLGSRLNEWATGEVPPEDLSLFRNSYRTARAENDNNIRTAHRTIASMLGPGSGTENYAKNVNTVVGGMFKAVGVDDAPPVYSDDATGEATSLGSGKRPVTAAKKGPKSNPLINARIESKLAAPDRDAVQMARKRLKANPQDQIAQQVLAKNGLNE